MQICGLCCGYFRKSLMSQTSVFLLFGKSKQFSPQKFSPPFGRRFWPKYTIFRWIFTIKSSFLLARKFWCFPIFYWKFLQFSYDFDKIFSIWLREFSEIETILKIVSIFSKIKNTGVTGQALSGVGSVLPFLFVAACEISRSIKVGWGSVHSLQKSYQIKFVSFCDLLEGSRQFSQ